MFIIVFMFMLTHNMLKDMIPKTRKQEDAYYSTWILVYPSSKAACNLFRFIL